MSESLSARPEARFALAAPAAIGWEGWRGLALERAVAEVKGMGAAQLEQAFGRSPWSRDKFFLGAIAQEKGAPGRGD